MIPTSRINPMEDIMSTAMKILGTLKAGFLLYNYLNDVLKAKQCSQASNQLQELISQASSYTSNIFVFSEMMIDFFKRVQPILINIWETFCGLYQWKHPQLHPKERYLYIDTFDRIFQTAQMQGRQSLMSLLEGDKEKEFCYTYKYFINKNTNITSKSNYYCEFLKFSEMPVKKMQYPNSNAYFNNNYQFSDVQSRRIFQMFNQVFDLDVEDDIRCDTNDMLNPNFFNKNSDAQYTEKRRKMIAELVFRKIKNNKLELVPFRVGTRPIYKWGTFFTDSIIRKIIHFQHACIQIGPFLFDYGVDSTVQQQPNQILDPQEVSRRSCDIQPISKANQRTGARRQIRQTGKCLFSPFLKLLTAFSGSSQRQNDNAYNIQSITEGHGQYSNWTGAQDMAHSGWSVLCARDVKLLIEELSDWGLRGRYNLLKKNCQGFVIFCLGLIYEANCIAYEFLDTEYQRRAYFAFDYTADCTVLSGRRLKYSGE